MSNKFYKKVTAVDDAGEIISQATTPYYNPFKDGRGYNFKYKSINVKSYLDIPLPDCFTDSEVGKVYRLSRYIYSDSNLLAKRTGGIIQPYTKTDIQSIIGLYRTKFNPFWNKIVKNKIAKQISLNGEDYWCFNPIYFNSTTYLPLYLYIEFQGELRHHLPLWVIQKYLDMNNGDNEESGGG